MKRGFLHIIFIIIISALYCSANAQSMEKLIKNGDAELEAGRYHQALSWYKQAFDSDTNSIDANFKYAEGLRLTKDFGKALWYYDKVYHKALGKLYPESLYWVAMLQKQTGNYRDAADSWKKVQKLFKKANSPENAKARHEQKVCRWAEFESRKKTEFELQRVKGDVAVEDAVFGGVIDGTNLWYNLLPTRDLDIHNPDDDFVQIRRAQFKDGAASGSEKLPDGINTSMTHNGNVAFSQDGKRMYFTRCASLPSQPVKEGPCMIMVSWKNGNDWGAPDAVGVVNDGESSSTQPWVSEIDGKEYLFFASDRKGGQGGYDIWYSLVTGGNQYGKPVNAGRLVNSKEDEMTPFYSTQDTALFFSSTWHQGFGGFDIHYAKGKPGSFVMPENLGRPYNTPGNDLYFRKHDKTVILTSNFDPANPATPCCNKLWHYEFPPEPVEEPETLEDLMKYLPVTLYFHNDRPVPNSLDTSTNLNYVSTLDHYLSLQPTYRDEYSKGLTTKEDVAEAIEAIDAFFADYAIKGAKDLERFTALLAEELAKGKNIELTIQGFASPLAETKYNVGLTKRRISSLINYLLEYERGLLRPYIEETAANGGTLDFVTIPFGEYSADQTVSDNPNDQKNSVYSRNAALERKIEIQKVKLVNPADTLHPQMKFLKEIFDAGRIKAGDAVQHTFSFTNVGNATLEITGIRLETEGADAIVSHYELKPGEKAELKVEVDTHDMKGHTVVKVVVETNGTPAEKELMITLEAK